MFQILVFVGVDFFPLQRLHEAFATGIVVGVCRPTHARNHVVLLEDGYIFRASVLQPSIRVMHQAPWPAWCSMSTFPAAFSRTRKRRPSHYYPQKRSRRSEREQ